MSKKLLKISSIILSVFLGIIGIMSVSSIIIILMGRFVNNFQYIHLLYLTNGLFFIPMEYIINKTVGRLNEEILFALSLVVAIVVMFMIIFALFDIKRLSKQEDEKDKKYIFILTSISAFIIIIYFIFSVTILLIGYNNIVKYLSEVSTPFVESVGKNFIIMLHIIIAFLGVAIAMFYIVTLFINGKKKKHIKFYGTTNFYSKEFEEIKKDVIIKQQEGIEQEKNFGDLRETKKQAKELILKIMQLDELKRTGQITEVEYTRLRQKAIKRYKV